nr:hybrid sensor histidine kinase/response regulator transcription factor [Foetidibacter luteolus]
MWFGTISGLNRYDGYAFKVFTHNAADTFSLMDNYVLKIFGLPGNKMFVQSRNGNSVYDPVTERFLNGNTYLESLGMPKGSIRSLAQAGKNLWLLYRDGSLYRRDEAGKTLCAGKQPGGDGNFISDIQTSRDGSLVRVYSNGIIEKLDANSGSLIFRTAAVKDKLGNRSQDFSVYEDIDGDLWLYCPTVPFGAMYYHKLTGRATHLYNKPGLLNNDIVNGIVQDDNGLIWMGTDHGGVNLLNKKTMTVSYLKNKDDDHTTISQNVITCMYKDRLGIVWLGTYKKGVNYYHENLTRFPVYRHLATNKNSLSYDDVNRFVEDANGNIWIGANGGGLIYFNRKTNTFHQYRHEPGNSNSISNDVIVSLWIDHRQKLWIGYYYGGLDCYDGNRFIHYRHKDGDTASLSEDRVWEIYEDREKNLWVGTYEGGLDRFDRQSNTFIHYKKGANGFPSNYVAALSEDRQGNLWVGTDGGISLLQKGSAKFKNLTVTSGLSNNDVICLLKDNSNNMWIGTRYGLNVYQEDSKKITSFYMKDGLPDNSVLNILQDDKGDIWISTPGGLARIKPAVTAKGVSITVKKYDELDGLQSRDFNENAACKTKSGELIFGGANGFNLFHPAAIKENKILPQIAFTEFYLFNRNIAVNEKINGKIILNQSIAETREIVLRHNQNVFSIGFAALSFDNTEKNQYAYRLNGFDKNWLVAPAGNRRATYTNLDAGTYTFQVKASNDDGVWNEQGILLRIKVLPPFWRTPLAYLFYFLLAAFVFLYARRVDMNRAKMRFELANERREARRLHELDMLKIKFFTNVSHEFKTPLSLILAPVDKLLKSSADTAQKKQFQLIHRNARRLLNLVNQLLDFRKMEVQELKLNPVQGDLLLFIREISCSFTDLAEKKNIRFFYAAQRNQFITRFDHDKIERILFNLLSNAFKFTHENGTVNVDVRVIETGKTFVEIKVKDTGIGIEEDKQAAVFEHFFQSDVPESMLNQGSGIGLSITREFVKMQGGSITVESAVGKGSCFTVQLPFDELSDDAPSDAFEMQGTPGNGQPVTVPDDVDVSASRNQAPRGKKQTILLVEDNDDFRFYLKDNLRSYFNILEAPNGKLGWQRVLASHPDLVVSDISMPVMDGIELCKRIKKDQRTKHIPVILLTALVSDDKHLEGLETGAADFMTKPFNFEIMLSRIRNILSEQKTLKQTYVRQVDAKASDASIASADEKFIQNALEVIEKNLSDPDFSVEDLSKELFMSRTAVYKKMFALTEKAPLDFIRFIRLQRAAQLLRETNLTVAEVAYEVGFNNPKYFARFFKAEYNMAPSAYVAENKKEPGSLNGTG